MEKALKGIQMLIEIAENECREPGCNPRFLTLPGYFGTGKDGKPDGIGKREYKGGCFYQGEWVEGRMVGIGMYQWNSSRRSFGAMNNGKLCGFGVEEANGKSACGEWNNGKLEKPMSPSQLIPASHLS